MCIFRKIFCYNAKKGGRNRSTQRTRRKGNDRLAIPPFLSALSVSSCSKPIGCALGGWAISPQPPISPFLVKAGDTWTGASLPQVVSGAGVASLTGDRGGGQLSPAVQGVRRRPQWDIGGTFWNIPCPFFAPASGGRDEKCRHRLPNVAMCMRLVTESTVFDLPRCKCPWKCPSAVGTCVYIDDGQARTPTPRPAMSIF